MWMLLLGAWLLMLMGALYSKYARGAKHEKNPSTLLMGFILVTVAIIAIALGMRIQRNKSMAASLTSSVASTTSDVLA